MNISRTVGIDGSFGTQPYFNGALAAAPALVAGPVAPTTMGHPRIMYSVVLFNPHTAAIYLQCFNAARAADVTVGTTAPAQSYGVAPGGSLQVFFGDLGMQYPLGIVVAATTGPTNNVAPATPTVVNIGYL